jgi:hypothetical protein
MIVAKGIPLEEFKCLTVGDCMFEDEIVRLHKKTNSMKICTRSGAVYTVHYKPWGCNVFKKAANEE